MKQDNYSDVLTSPWNNGHYMATLALAGIYLTTIWSWRGWHAAHLTSPYKVLDNGALPRTEIYRFYTDIAIVVAYAYTLFQVEPLVKDPAYDLVWLLIGYPIIVILYGVETRLRMKTYGRDARRTIPVALTLLAHILVALVYLYVRHRLVNSGAPHHDFLVLNGCTLVAALLVMLGYRHFNELYKRKLLEEGSFFERVAF